MYKYISICSAGMSAPLFNRRMALLKEDRRESAAAAHEKNPNI